MDLRVIARVRAIDEDSLLKEMSGIEDYDPATVDYDWRIKYIKSVYIDTYWELEKGKTVINYKDGNIEIIREDIDEFAKRLAAERKKAAVEEVDEDYSVEEGIEIEFETGNEEEEE
jgi:hypothetical protein